MDGRGRLAQSLTWTASWIVPWPVRPAGHARAAPRGYSDRRKRPAAARSSAGRLLRRWSLAILNWRVPSGAGMAACGLFLLATLTYGIVIGDRAPMLVGAFKDSRDAAANAAGFFLSPLAATRERAVYPGAKISAPHPCRAGPPLL